MGIFITSHLFVQNSTSNWLDIMNEIWDKNYCRIYIKFRGGNSWFIRDSNETQRLTIILHVSWIRRARAKPLFTGVKQTTLITDFTNGATLIFSWYCQYICGFLRWHKMLACRTCRVVLVDNCNPGIYLSTGQVFYSHCELTLGLGFIMVPSKRHVDHGFHWCKSGRYVWSDGPSAWHVFSMSRASQVRCKLSTVGASMLSWCTDLVRIADLANLYVD